MQAGCLENNCFVAFRQCPIGSSITYHFIKQTPHVSSILARVGVHKQRRLKSRCHL